MAAAIDIHAPRKVAIVASNPATSPVTGLPVGFWWSELTHPYWELTAHGYDVTVHSPDGGRLEADGWSDPRDPSGYSAEDLITLGFVNSPDHVGLVDRSRPISEIDVAATDAVLFIGGQGPMVTFRDDARVQTLASDVVESGKLLGVICHATCLLLDARRAGGGLLVDGRTWTGFSNAEEDFAEEFVGQPIQPFRIEDEARKLAATNFIVRGRFTPHAVRDGNLITGQQQYSGAAAARLIVEALGA
jgi:putative intracellular protease/amidase